MRRQLGLLIWTSFGNFGDVPTILRSIVIEELMIKQQVSEISIRQSDDICCVGGWLSFDLVHDGTDATILVDGQSDFPISEDPSGA